MKKYMICRHIGNISRPDNGWTNEHNLISWSDRKSVYDLRTWNVEHTEYGKGITITAADFFNSLYSAFWPVSAA